MEFNAFLLTLARVNLKPGVSLQPSVVAAIFNYFAQLRRCKRWYLHILQKKRNSPNFVESQMHPGWRGGMTLITWNSRRTNPTHTPAHSPLTLSTFSSDNIHKKQWQLSKETVTTLARNSDHVHTEKWQFPHWILTTFTWNSDAVFTSSLCYQCYPQGREVSTAWLFSVDIWTTYFLLSGVWRH